MMPSGAFYPDAKRQQCQCECLLKFTKGLRVWVAYSWAANLPVAKTRSAQSTVPTRGREGGREIEVVGASRVITPLPVVWVKPYRCFPLPLAT